MKRLPLLIFLLMAFSVTGLSAESSADSLARILGIVQQDKASMIASGAYLPLGGCVIQLFYEKDGQLDSLYTSSVSASYMMQTWNPTYGRYFMLNISYVFRKKK